VGHRQRDGLPPLLSLSVALRDLLARFVPRGAIVLAVLTFGAYAMGLLRDRAFARTFGAGAELDAYNAALALPELVLGILVTSGLVAAFVPVYSGLAGEGLPRADAFGRVVLTVATTIMAVAVAIMFLLAPATIELVAPGFDPAQRDLYVSLFRIMCITAIVFAASFTLGEILVSRQRYLAYAISPILYNAGIVGGTILLGDRYGIYGAAIGTVVGAFLHLMIRVVDVARAGFRIAIGREIRMPAFAEYVRLSIPKMVSQPIEPLTFLYFTRVASEFAAGSVSAVSFARNFASVPVVVIGVQFAIAAFPILSRSAAAGDRQRFVTVTRSSTITIGILTIVAAAALVVIGGPAIELLLGGGAFDAEDVALTSLLLVAFSISIPLESLTQLLARAIYATRNTILPVLAAVVGLVVTVVAVTFLTGSIGIVGMPIGYAVGYGVRLVLLLAVLPGRVGRIGRSPTT
jgi:putative peptidoglycan lipid II flippase